MKGFKGLVLAVLAMAALSGCRKRDPFKPLTPKKPVPPGIVRIDFTRKVTGPIDLTLDGVRIPIAPLKKNKKAMALIIGGLPAGKHTYFLSSQQDAFGQDQGEFEVTADKGTFLLLFAQHFNAILYGKPEPLPAAEGLPGVRATLEP